MSEQQKRHEAWLHRRRPHPNGEVTERSMNYKVLNVNCVV